MLDLSTHFQLSQLFSIISLAFKTLALTEMADEILRHIQNPVHAAVYPAAY